MAKTKRNHVNKSRKHQKKYKMKGSAKHRRTHKKHFFSKKYSVKKDVNASVTRKV